MFEMNAAQAVRKVRGGGDTQILGYEQTKRPASAAAAW